MPFITATIHLNFLADASAKRASMKFAGANSSRIQPKAGGQRCGVLNRLAKTRGEIRCALASSKRPAPASAYPSESSGGGFCTDQTRTESEICALNRAAESARQGRDQAEN